MGGGGGGGGGGLSTPSPPFYPSPADSIPFIIFDKYMFHKIT